MKRRNVITFDDTRYYYESYESLCTVPLEVFKVSTYVVIKKIILEYPGM